LGIESDGGWLIEAGSDCFEPIPSRAANRVAGDRADTSIPLDTADTMLTPLGYVESAGPIERKTLGM